MESYDHCLNRAQADRQAAAQTQLPNERARYERSAENWEEMAARALQTEQHRIADEARKAEMALERTDAQRAAVERREERRRERKTLDWPFRSAFAAD